MKVRAMTAARAAKLEWIEQAVSSATDDCIDWPWGLVEGYGSFKWEGANKLVHVQVCERVYGPRPEHEEAAHSCGRRPCANPRHLRWATRSSNNLDKRLHGTDNRGDRHPLAKLSPAEVADIRKLHSTGDYRLVDLAEMFGVCISNVHYIVKGQTWVPDHQDKRSTT